MNRRLRAVRWCTIGIAAVAGLAAVTSASAGPLTALAVDPTQLVLVGAAKGQFTLRNPSSNPLKLNATIGNYVIKPNGVFVVNPKLPPARSAKRWVSISPKQFTIKPRGNFILKVRSHPGRKAGPGDHHALVLFTTTPSGKGKVLVRTRIGVAVLVRVKGKIKRRVLIGGLSAVRSKHQLRLILANRGNINERLLRHTVSVALKQGSRTVQTLWAPPRDILPHSRSIYGLPYRRALKGTYSAIVKVRPINGPRAGALAPTVKPFQRTFRVRF
jgi:hypothetical protein